MKAFSAEDLDFYYYDRYSEEHHQFIESLLKDEAIKTYFPNLVKTFADSTTQLLVSNAAGNLVGWQKKYDGDYSNDRSCELMYIVGENFRVPQPLTIRRDLSQETVGAKIIRTAANYFLINSALEFVELYIEVNNTRSIRAALHAGFAPVNNHPSWYLKTEPTKYIPDIEPVLRGMGK